MKKLLPALLLISSSCMAQDVAQMLQSITNARSTVSSGGTVTLGLQTSSGDDGGGDANQQFFVPLVMQSGASGYTSTTIHLKNGATAVGNAIVGYYTATNSGCPSGFAGVCPGARVCQSASTAVTSGDQAITLSGCPSFSAGQTIFIGAVVSSGSFTYAWNGSGGCPSGGGLEAGGGGSFSLSNPAGTVSVAVNACFTMYGVFTCTGACGTTMPNYMVVDYSGGTALGAVSAANLNSSTHCSIGAWSVSGGGAINLMTYQTSPLQAFVTSVVAPCNGTTYTGTAPGLAINRITGPLDQAPNDLLTFGFTYDQPSVSAGFWMRTDTPQNLGSGNACDVFTLGAGNGSAMTFQIFGNGTNLLWRMERVQPTTATFNGPNLATNTYVWATGQWIPGTSGTAAFYDTTGTQIGANVNVTGTASGVIGNVSLGNAGSCFSTPVQNIFYGGIKVEPTGAVFPVVADLFPDGPAILGPQLAEMVHEGKLPSAEIRDGRWWSNVLGRFVGE